MVIPPKISLAAARVNAKKTQAEVAAEIGVSKATIINWENGHTSPGWDVIKRLEALYAYPFDFVQVP